MDTSTSSCSNINQLALPGSLSKTKARGMGEYFGSSGDFIRHAIYFGLFLVHDIPNYVEKKSTPNKCNVPKFVKLFL